MEEGSDHLSAPSPALIRAARALASTAVVCALLSASARAEAPKPWATRCEARLQALVPQLAALGRARVVVQVGRPSGALGDRDRFGAVAVELVGKAGARWSAAVGDDHAGHRHVDPKGLAETRYEVWHSAYEDALDGELPAGEVRDERHHRVGVGVLRAELRASAASPTEDTARWRALVAPALEACLADVAPLEGDPSFGWTTECLAQLGAASVVAVARAPRLLGAGCRRAPFEASCGRVEGLRPTFNALLLLGAKAADARAPWTPSAQGEQRERLGDSAMIWAHAATDAEWSALTTAFEPALRACVARAVGARGH